MSKRSKKKQKNVKVAQTKDNGIQEKTREENGQTLIKSSISNEKGENEKSTKLKIPTPIDQRIEINAIAFVHPMKNGLMKEFVFESMFDTYNNGNRGSGDSTKNENLVKESIDDILQLKNDGKDNTNLEADEDKSEENQSYPSSDTIKTINTTPTSTEINTDSDSKTSKKQEKVRKIAWSGG